MNGVVYLSGPISLGGTSPPEEIERFKDVFMLYECALTELGYDVINPVNCEEQTTWEDYMKLHIPSVCRADIVAILPKFQLSRGSVLEVFIANQLEIPVVPVSELCRLDRLW